MIFGFETLGEILSVSFLLYKEVKMIGDKKEVFFDRYCSKCEYKNRPETANPCWDCLDSPSNVDSHRPVYFKEASENEKQINGKDVR